MTAAPAIRTDAAEHLTRTQAAADLAAVREQWGDLLAAITRRPAAEWPPRDNIAALLDAPADEDDDQAAPALGRLPLTLREHPAPLNLDALDAAVSVEDSLFHLADVLAATVQRPVRLRPSLNIPSYSGRRAPLLNRARMVVDHADRDDPARWHLASNRDAGGPSPVVSAGSRAYGLHWAAVWIEGRLLGENLDEGLFRPVPVSLLDDAAATARRARLDVERALGRDGRTVTLDVPCPWCGGELTGETQAGGEPFVTCWRGEACGAPVVLDRRRRVWRSADLVGLWVAMEAARKRAAEQQA